MSRSVAQFAGKLAILVGIILLWSACGAAQCPPCVKDETPMAGHGAVSTTDNRRVINIQIDSSWNSSPGKTNDIIWNAVQCAINQWNTATDGSGHTTGYFFKVDQTTSSPDIKIVQGTPSVGAGYAQTTIGNGGKGPDTTTLAATNTGRRPQDICGAIDHEIGHAIGLGEKSTTSCTSANQTVMDGTYANGQRPVNDVQPSDVAQSNANLNPATRSSCADTLATMGDPGPGGPPEGTTCTTPAPNSSCVCNTNGTWTCATCQGNPPNDTCTCDDAGHWNCECDGFPRTCSDGTSEVCYDGGWTCGTVTVSACTGHAPVCEDGYPAECVNDTWDCPGSQVCPP